jgi:hypothetical protein
MGSRSREVSTTRAVQPDEARVSPERVEDQGGAAPKHCATLISELVSGDNSVKAVTRGMFALAAAIVAFGDIDVLAADPDGRPSADQPAPLTAPH